MSDAPTLDAVFLPSERIVGRRIVDEFLLVPLAGRGADVDALYNLNRVGAFIWERLDGRRDGRAVVQALVERFDVERERAVADYRAFVAQLEALHAVRRVGEATSA
jgi:Coenzyme PQQ synthesis protein D (PqqD)